jgi:hypothetical protein
MALGKENVQNFFQKSLPKATMGALGKDSFFAEGCNEGPRQRPNGFKKN